MAWISRRTFIRGALGVGAVGVIGGGGWWLTKDWIRLGIVGAGVRGNTLAEIVKKGSYIDHRCGEVVAVCDVDRPAAETLTAKWCPKAERYDDYRKLIARDDIDAVIVCPPDHWHAAVAEAALKSGKAVYCEKPMTLTIAEGQELVRTVESTGRPFLVGLQQRNDWNFRTAAELVRAGRLGTVHTATIRVAPRKSKGGTPDAVAPPAGLNWDFWLGTAPSTEYSTIRHLDWHQWWEYGGGEITNWATHHVDIAHWALQLPNEGQVAVDGAVIDADSASGLPAPKLFSVTCQFPGGLKMVIETATEGESGVDFVGDRGMVHASRVSLSGSAVDELAANPLPATADRLHPNAATKNLTTLNHMRHFYRCVRGIDQPIADVKSVHRSTTTCHLGNIALRLGRKLTWDPAAEKFVNDSEADALCWRDVRATYL